MKNIIFKSIFLLLVFIISPYKVFANTKLDVYMNDFYSKSNEARQILKELESSLKDGSRQKVCLRQKEAARIGMAANKSLIKAFKVAGAAPPIASINASQMRWESMLNEC